ncbi:PBX3-like protein [Mya arenaria]|uniref:PBX3-like protein n=1 Tax=Mya arenaria TaxID=6604 RepID=A0ABY7F923_MYAAR|nr:PBX3-like protein [Mya arenaria]
MLSSYGASEHSRAVDSTNLYPTFAAPTPLNKAHIGNMLTPGMIPSPLNLPAITPPASPYSIFGLYSPGSGSHGSPLCDPGYLRRLKNNPMFRDLQSLLLQECLQMQVPSNLITTSWNLMQLHKTTPSDQSTNQKAASSFQSPISAHQNSATSLQPPASGSGQQVYMQHMKFQDKLLKVRIDPAISADGLSVENKYSTEVGNIEMERYRALNSCPDENVKDTINQYYDKQRLKLIQNTDEKLDQLINKTQSMRREVPKSNNSDAVNLTKTLQGEQPTLSLSGTAQGASLLLQPVEEKDKIYAVRKLKFNDEAEDNDDDENDYLNGSVNSEDFEIDEIDVETVDKTELTAHVSKLVSSENDILKKCIEESGLGAFDISPVDLSTAASVNSIESMIPDSTSSASDSPISMASAEDLTNQNLSTDGSENSTFSKEEHSVSHFHLEEQLKKPVTRNLNFDNHMFSTPTSNIGMKFTNPDNIQASLSEIQKLCGASTMTFTPEYRKNMGEFNSTPVDVKPMPLNEMSSAFNMPSANMSYRPVSNNMYQFGVKHGFQQRHLHRHQHEQQQQLKLQQHMARPTFPRSSSPNDNFKQQHYSYHQKQQFHLQQQQQQHRQTHQYQPQRPKSIDSTNNNFQLNNDNITSTSNSNITNNIQDSMNISSSEKSIKTKEFQFENTPEFRTHRMLTPESTEVLLTWYNAHVNYPYPNDEEVKHLTKLTGITARQVKKWMANRRVRCFNTLSITGNQHPIKHKYKGQGRKRKAPMPEKPEKENCDSTTADKRPNYSMLGEEAKSILSEWYEQHIDNPYPTEEEKIQLAEHCRISVNQVKSWFANKRNRTNNTKRQVPNYFIERFPEYSGLVHLVGQKREEERMLKRRKVNDVMNIQPPFYF